MIYYGIELYLTWSRNRIISEISRIPEVGGANPEDAIQTGATFKINNAKPYVSVVTLSVNYNITFLENIKQ